MLSQHLLGPSTWKATCAQPHPMLTQDSPARQHLLPVSPTCHPSQKNGGGDREEKARWRNQENKGRNRALPGRLPCPRARQAARHARSEAVPGGATHTHTHPPCMHAVTYTVPLPAQGRCRGARVRVAQSTNYRSLSQEPGLPGALAIVWVQSPLKDSRGVLRTVRPESSGTLRIVLRERSQKR